MKKIRRKKENVSLSLGYVQKKTVAKAID